MTNRKKYFLLFTFFGLVVFVRLFFLMRQSPFLDEAIYVNLAYGINLKPTLNDILFPFEAGLSPLFIYFTAIAISFFHNPFFSGRIVSLLISFLTTFILFLFLRKIKAKNILLPLVFFYFNPMTWMYSQMALLETTMLLFATLFLFQTEIVLNKPTRLNILLLSAIFMLVILSKYTGSFVVLYFIIKCLYKKSYYNLVLFLVFSLVMFILSLPINSKLFVTFSMHSESKQLFQLQIIKYHLHLLFAWMKDYFQIFILFFLGGMTFFNRKKPEVKIAILTVFFMYLFFTFGATNLFPRYLYLIILMLALPLSLIKNKIISIVFLFLLIIFYLPTDYKIIFDLKNANIAKEDVYQYETDWTSGKNIMNIFNNTARGQTVCIVKNEFEYFKIIKISFFDNEKFVLQKNCDNQKNNTARTSTE